MLCLVSKAESFILMNNLHSRLTDFFFVHFTFIGDGGFSLFIFVILFLTNQKKLATCVLLAYVTSGCFAQLLKHLISAPRPKIYFETSGIPYYIDFFKTSNAGNNSFPSGHTTSAFALATVLASHFKKPLSTIALFVAALLVGYSRIYIGEHFPLDVWTGMWIGILFGLVSVILIKHTTFSLPKFKGPKSRGATKTIFAE